MLETLRKVQMANNCAAADEQFWPKPLCRIPSRREHQCHERKIEARQQPRIFVDGTAQLVIAVSDMCVDMCVDTCV